MDLDGTFDTDGYGTCTIAHWGGWRVQLMPMLYNARLVLTPEACPGVYDFGWCYPTHVSATVAAAAWDPETDGEPPGFIKAATAVRRRPGQKAADGSPGAEHAAFLGAILGIDLLEQQ